MQSTSYSRKVRISIVSLYDNVWFNRSLNGLATSFELHLPYSIAFANHGY